MKIALFLHDLRAGGAERVSVNLANAMREMGHDIDLVLVNQKGCRAFFSRLDASIRIIELPQSRTLTSALGFRSYIARERPDFVISALTHINVSALIARALSWHRPRILIVEHGQFSREAAKPMAVSVRLAYWLAPWIYPSADMVAAVSYGARLDLASSIEMAAERIAVLYNPVVTKHLIEESYKPVDHPWFDEHKVPVILAVGALRAEKNFPLLIEAFAVLRGRREARLIILGSGPEEASLAKFVASSRYADDVELLGFDANPARYMRRASVLALSSDHEALPTVLIEAMACGTPVVSTDCPAGPAEILKDGAFGELVKTGDPTALADALGRALDTPISKSRLVERAADFSSKCAAERYLALSAGDTGCEQDLLAAGTQQSDVQDHILADKI